MIVILHIVLSILLSEFAVTSSTTDSSHLVYGFNCSKDGNYTPNSLYQYSLDNVLGNLNSEAPRSEFYRSSYGQSPNQVFALYLCRGDVGSQRGQRCSDCVNGATNTIVKNCPYQTGGIIFYDRCMVRYSDQSFFGKMDVFPSMFLYNNRNITGNQTKFGEVLRDTMNNLVVEAAIGDQSGKKFATNVINMTSLQSLYALEQCTPDLTTSDCERCLRVGIAQLPISSGGRVLLPSCIVRYDSKPFFNTKATSSLGRAIPHDSTNSTRSPGRRQNLLRVGILIAVSMSLVISLLGGGIWIYMRKKKGAVETSKSEINEMRTMGCLEFDLNTIRAATHNFSVDNKLGEGGFGEVYKGILKDGQEVAIKRLSKNSGQGIEEFKTEVVLVAKLQHINLVKLLGFCLASTEKILVYEFLQNSSLDHFLFDVTKKLLLNWETRFKLIVGVGRGLLYLHEDSRLRIIHRDLKPSNILLDEAMNPKISDFGLAKLFRVDQTQDDTKRIVGTYGYMAPEYAMTGHFSVKSDVYSFGIIVLEIVSGQKNRFFGRPQWEEALLHRAWRLWNEEKGLDLVDTTLNNKFPREEVTKCIHIGLLCIQESAVERPRMATVVAALNGQSISLPIPKPPNFFGNTTTTTSMFSPYYDSLMGGNEIEYRPQLDRQGYIDIYSGTEKITELYPR